MNLQQKLHYAQSEMLDKGLEIAIAVRRSYPLSIHRVAIMVSTATSVAGGPWRSHDHPQTPAGPRSESNRRSRESAVELINRHAGDENHRSVLIGSKSPFHFSFPRERRISDCRLSRSSVRRPSSTASRFVFKPVARSVSRINLSSITMLLYQTARPLIVRARSLTVVLCNQFPDLRHKLARDAHDCVGGLNTGFILDQSILLALLLVISEHLSDLLFSPSFREVFLAHCCFFLLRLRNAARGLPVTSYAVMTNTLSGSGSGT